MFKLKETKTGYGLELASTVTINDTQIRCHINAVIVYYSLSFRMHIEMSANIQFDNVKLPLSFVSYGHYIRSS